MRYKVINESVSAHCCFVATVVDTWTPCPVWHDKGSKKTICECFSKSAAEKVARALNAEEDAVDEGEVGAYAAATYEQMKEE